MLVHKTTAEYRKYSLFITKTGNIFCCLVQKHDPKTVYWFLQRTLSLLWFWVLWRVILNIHTNILSCLRENHWPNFVSEHPMFLPMFCHQTFVNACSEKHVHLRHIKLIPQERIRIWQRNIIKIYTHFWTDNRVNSGFWLQ